MTLVEGREYRVTKSPAWEYLTVGQVYTADSVSKRAVSLHRDGGKGAGTIIDTRWIRTGHIVLELV